MASTFRELTVKFGYGNIAAKMWGENSSITQKFLAVHGWLDNAGSFDPLMRHFVTADRCVVCIDYPGHGLSSHHPKGLPYTPASDLLAMRSVIQHLGWKHYSLIGHSMGAMRSQQYTLSWPNEVDSVVLLDGFVLPAEVNKLQHDADDNIYLAFGRQIDNFVRFTTEFHGNNREHTWEELAERWMKAAPGITMDDFTILMKRGATKKDNGKYVYTRDPALHNRQNSVLMQTIDTNLAAAKKNPVHHLLIKASEGVVKFHSQDKTGFLVRMASQYINEVKLVDIDGEHHIHMHRPEEIVSIMNHFLEEVKDKKEADSKL